MLDSNPARAAALEIMWGDPRRRKTVDGCPLTPRELEVAQLVADGKVDKEIADILVISQHTVKYYINRLRRKLKRCNKAAIAAEVVRRGWVP